MGNKVTLLLETDGKKHYLWVNQTLIKESPAKNVYILGKPADELKLLRDGFRAMSYQVECEIFDHVKNESWEL